MPAVLRLATLVDRRFELDRRAFAIQAAQLDALDRLCRTLGVPLLSQFVDLTALELREASQLVSPTEARAPAEPDPVTGLAWGIEDTAWYPCATGLTCLDALAGHLQRNPAAARRLTDPADVLGALQHWQRRLEPLELEGGQFHLSAD